MKEFMLKIVLPFTVYFYVVISTYISYYKKLKKYEKYLEDRKKADEAYQKAKNYWCSYHGGSFYVK
jgi:hypothetical protein